VNSRIAKLVFPIGRCKGREGMEMLLRKISVGCAWKDTDILAAWAIHIHAPSPAVWQADETIAGLSLVHPRDNGISSKEPQYPRHGSATYQPGAPSLHNSGPASALRPRNRQRTHFHLARRHCGAPAGPRRVFSRISTSIARTTNEMSPGDTLAASGPLRRPTTAVQRPAIRKESTVSACRQTVWRF